MVLKEKIFDTPFRIVLFVGTSAIGFGFMLLYDHILLRYGVAVIFTGIVYRTKGNQRRLLMKKFNIHIIRIKILT